METEIWKDIDGYEGIYAVSNMGRVKSLSRKKYARGILYRGTTEEIILKYTLNGNGYPKFGLMKDRKVTQKMVHRLVAIAFIPNPNNHPVVNHKNGDKKDFSIENLEWCTHKENITHSVLNGWSPIGERVHTSKLKLHQVAEIRTLYKAGNDSYYSLARAYGVSFGLIGAIVRGEKWSHTYQQLA